MIWKANLREAVRSLLNAKQRTALALIGIVIGIGSVIAMVTIGQIAQQESLKQFKELGTDVLTLEKDFGASTSVGGLPLPPLMSLRWQVPALTDVAAATQGGGGEVVFQGKALERTLFMGVTQSFAAFNKLVVEQGRFLHDLDARSRHAVVGSEVATQMKAAGVADVLGRQLRVEDDVLTVIGVLAPASQGGLRRFDPNTVVLVHAAMALRLPGTEVAYVNLRVAPSVGHAEATQIVHAHLGKLPKLPPVRISSPQDIVAQMERQAQMYTLLLGAIGSISLVVGGVGVMNVMLVSVSERRREIGIRRALGAQQGDILGQFLIESVILSLIGGLLGVMLGMFAGWGVCEAAGWTFVFSGFAVALGVGVSSAVGVFFGFYPAREAARLNPIVALRGH